jgi:hypothetical protein
VELFLHIGTEKTGTTSIQKFFRWNREALEQNGVLYPVSPGNQNHMGLAVSAQDVSKRGPMRKSQGVTSTEEAEAFRAKLVNSLTEEIANGAHKTVVMSGEHMSSRLLEDEEVLWLKNLLTPFFEKITVVCYIRRQDDYLLSTYSTAVKSGFTQPLRIPSERTISVRYDHWEMLSRWARIFGRENIVCRKFERAALAGGDVVEDFMAIAGIPPRDAYERPPEVNQSLDAELLEYLRLFNTHVPRFVKRAVNPDRDNIVLLLNAISKGPLITLPGDELAKFMALFRESNAKVAMEYFGGVRTDSDDPLFERHTDKRERTGPVTLTPERAVEISTVLWLEKQAQLERVQQRLEEFRQGKRGPGRKRRNEESEDESESGD